MAQITRETTPARSSTKKTKGLPNGLDVHELFAAVTKKAEAIKAYNLTAHSDMIQTTRKITTSTRASTKKNSTPPEGDSVRPCFSHAHLVECYERGNEWGLNRRLAASVKRLPKTAVYPVFESFAHYHADGVRVAEHIRCVVVINFDGDCLTVDVPKSFFKCLPRS
ncbi:hypothetical protein J0H58_12570 [bacterium]|nr:hypothetical protein [bacterium]